MFGQKLRQSIFAATVGLLAAVGVTPASAIPNASFTWSPSTSNPALNLAGATFTADNFTVTDWSTININTVTGAFTEGGILQIAQFQNLGANISPGGFGAGGYQLYFTFTASGTLAGACPISCIGPFSTLNVTLIGDKGGNATFSNAGVSNPLLDPQITLATGTLLNPGVLSPTNFAQLTLGIPTAQTLTTFVEDPAQTGFFIAPGFALDLNGAFTNNQNQATLSNCPGTTCVVTITSGGGSGSFLGTVPEPMTISMFGFGLLLLGAGAARRRRAA
jgi:hypothetical protein